MWDPNRSKVSRAAVALFVLSVAIGFGISALIGNRLPSFVGLLIGVYLLFSIKIADQWEKVAVLRLGRYIGLRGPGLFHVIPIVDRLSRYVDQRVRVASVTAESTLTRDTVPVNVDAIVFWLVWNAEKSILEVEDFVQAITLSAQTACGNRLDATNWADDYGARVAGTRAPAYFGREDQPLGHYGAIGGDP